MAPPHRRDRAGARVRGVVAWAIFSVVSLTCAAGSGRAGVRVVGYYPSWLKTKYPVAQVDFSCVTHIAQAFVWPNTNGTLDVTSDWSFNPELVQEAHAHGVKIVVSVGGGGRGSKPFAAMANDGAARSNFVQELTAFCASNHYDGADIDWESPSNAIESTNFTALISELRASFKKVNPSWTLSAAIRSRPWAGKWLDIDRLKDLLDWAGVMTYDYHGPWVGHSGHDAPLYGSDTDPCQATQCADASVEYYLSRHLPREKLLLGLPFYGYQFTSKALYATNTAGLEIKYADTQRNISNGWTRVWDDTARVPYLVNPDHTLLASYDDQLSISHKCDYVVSHHLGGVIIWALGLDLCQNQTPLLEVTGAELLPSRKAR